MPTVTIVQDEAYPPFMMSDGGSPSGIYADIVVEADKRLPDYKIDLLAAPWTRAKFLVETGKVDALLGTYFRPTARPWIKHYSSPLLSEDVFVYCRQGVAKGGWTYPDDYAGLLFANNSGFGTPGQAFFKMVEEGTLAVVEEQTTEENLHLLQIGRADCYVQEKTAVVTHLNSGKYNSIEAIQKVSSEPAHIGYGLTIEQNNLRRFVADMDVALESMSTDGTIDRIISRHTDSCTVPKPGTVKAISC
ncbi:MAG: transporter substrate-binding domain-containing protein [Roseibium sp.]